MGRILKLLNGKKPRGLGWKMRRIECGLGSDICRLTRGSAKKSKPFATISFTLFTTTTGHCPQPGLGYFELRNYVITNPIWSTLPRYFFVCFGAEFACCISIGFRAGKTSQSFLEKLNLRDALSANVYAGPKVDPARERREARGQWFLLSIKSHKSNSPQINSFLGSKLGFQGGLDGGWGLSSGGR